MLSALSQFIFGNSGLFGNKQASSGSPAGWRDKSVCFDLRQADLELALGEQLIACLFPIEDVKGNPDQLGLLKLTNLRLIWLCCERKRVNLSIGWRTVSLTFEQTLKDSLGVPQSSLVVLTKSDSIKYEFVFKRQLGRYSSTWDNHDNWSALMQLAQLSRDDAPPVSHLTPMHLVDYNEVVFKVWSCYKMTHLFRVCRANLTNLKPATSSPSGTSSSNQLPDAGSQLQQIYNKLPGEQTIDTFQRVFYIENRNFKSVGVLILTSLRLIWIDEALPLKNLSIPYIRMEFVKLKQSDRIQVGVLDYLVSSHQIELLAGKTSQQQSDHLRRSKMIFDQVSKLYQVYKARPQFGAECCEECLSFIGLLRPIENFDDFVSSVGELGGFPVTFTPGGFLAQSTIQLIPGETPGGNGSDRGAEAARLAQLVGFASNIQTGASDETVAAEKLRMSAIMEESERDLQAFSSNLNNYLNEKPIEGDGEVVYAEGECIL